MAQLPPPIERLAPGFDLNLSVYNGLWEVDDPLNGPGEGTWFVQVFRSALTTPNDLEITQVAYNKATGVPRFRAADEGAWSEWVPASEGGDADLSNYYTKAQSDGRFQPLGAYLTASDLVPYYTKLEADSAFQPAGTYLVPSDLNEFYTKEESDEAFQAASELLSAFSALGFGSGSKILATNGSAISWIDTPEGVDLSNYYTKAEADGAFQAKGSYLVASDLTPYLTSAIAEDTYQLKGSYLTASDLSGYLTVAAANDAYQPKGTYLVASDLNGYLTSAAAEEAYQPKGSYLVAADLNGYLLESAAEEAYQPIAGILTDLATKGYGTNSQILSTDGSGFVWIDTPEGVDLSNYYTKAEADGAFQAKGSYLVASDLNGYLTEVAADDAYQPKGSYLVAADLSPYLTSADAALTYQAKGSYLVASDLSPYLTSATAATTYQPVDSDLTAIAALTTTTFGRALLTQADAAATRSTLGLVIGTNVQAYDADLTTWAGLTPSSDAQSLVTAANYAAMVTLLGLTIGTNVQAYDSDLASIAALTTTSFGRSLLTQADSSAARSTLGLVIGTNVQAYDADLTTWAGLTPSANAQSFVTAANYAAMVSLLGLSNANTGSITFVIDGGGAAITTGIKGDLKIPYGCTITEAAIYADQTGSIAVNIWKDTDANFPPTVAGKITSSTPPTLSSAVKATDTTLTSWVKTIAAGDILRYNVDSTSGVIKRVTIALKVVKS